MNNNNQHPFELGKLYLITRTNNPDSHKQFKKVGLIKVPTMVLYKDEDIVRIKDSSERVTLTRDVEFMFLELNFVTNRHKVIQTTPTTTKIGYVTMVDIPENPEEKTWLYVEKPLFYLFKLDC